MEALAQELWAGTAAVDAGILAGLVRTESAGSAAEIVNPAFKFNLNIGVRKADFIESRQVCGRDFVEVAGSLRTARLISEGRQNRAPGSSAPRRAGSAPQIGVNAKELKSVVVTTIGT